MFIFKEPVNHEVWLEARSNDIGDIEKGLYKETYFQLFRMTDHSSIDIGRTCLAPMPGCCGVVISYNTFLNKDSRHSGLSDPFRKLKENLAKHLGYTLMIATTQASNVPAAGNFIKSKYNVVKTFVNKRTNNLLWLGIKEL